MHAQLIMTQLIVADLDRSIAFYESLFGRAPDARPMEGLAEWHFPDAGGVQVYAEPGRAGKSGVTIGVESLDDQVAELDAVGIGHDPPMQATYVRVVQLADPDGNRIVFTQ